ncbi:MAG: adhesion protein FadA [Fusobacteriaceae bacterium]|nr:adhesion protein FadA [Fusobacteriaceae bacterium]
MKKILLFIGSLLVVVNALAVSADEVREKYDLLEYEYQELEAQEEAKYQDAKNRAGIAKDELTKQRALYAQISTKTKEIKSIKKGNELAGQYAELAARYEEGLKALDAQIKVNEKVLAEFDKIEAIKNPKVKEEVKKEPKTKEKKEKDTKKKPAKK